ncbi:membrane protein insertion efficiency factor YidD [bacterium]|nr:membrane protein insertion efficiency factor YidD [bacterium]
MLKPIKRAVLLAAFGQVSECRQNPSCSEYMLRETQKNGWSGFWRGLKRIGRCF